MAVLILAERKEQCRLFHAVTLLELINTSAAVNEFLAAGVEGVALGADFNLELALYGTALEGFTCPLLRKSLNHSPQARIPSCLPAKLQLPFS